MSRETLFWIGMVFGAGAIVIYFAVLGIRPRVVRMVNGSGLFLTGLGLIQAAIVMRDAPPFPAWVNANAAVVALSLAVAAQSVAVLRNRKSWDGLDRRGSPSADGPGSPTSR